MRRIHKFKCPECTKRCQLNKKLSDIRGRKEGERVYVWICDGRHKNKIHAPIIWREQIESITLDDVGRVQNKISKLTRIMIEDGEAHELLDDFKQYMSDQASKGYNELPKAVVRRS